MPPILPALLHHLRRGPWAAELCHRYRVALRFGGPGWLVYGAGGLLGVQAEPAGSAEAAGLDAVIEGEPADLTAMLAGTAPPGTVRLRLGDREIPPRRAQAHGLIVAAALGWAGPLPDPAASADHRRLLRRAVLDLRLGAEEERWRLLPAGAPEIEARGRAEAGGLRLCTEGASDHGLPEFHTLIPPRAEVGLGIARLRAAIRAWGAGAREIEAGGARWRLEAAPLPLATGPGLLVELAEGREAVREAAPG